MSLPYYRKYGWEPTVLCVSAETSDGVDDRILAQSLPPDIPVKAADAWNERACRRFGFGQLGRRAVFPLYRLGSLLLAREKYDVVFFSTTVFGIFILAPIWKWRFGCKIVYDMQDPWYLGQAAGYSRENAPGGWWKYRLDQAINRYLERFAFTAVDHIICVSASYIDMLMRRYPRLNKSHFSIIPFGATPDDYAFARKQKIRQTVFSVDGATKNWVFTGGVIPNMVPVLRTLFSALRDLITEQPRLESILRIHFVGTRYVVTDHEIKNVEPLARDCGLEKIVHEQPARVPYLDSLVLSTDSDALLMIGSIHKDYTASKLMNYAMTKKPILAILHRDSLAHQMAARFPNVFLVGFSDDLAEPAVTRRVREGLLWLLNPTFDADVLEREIAPWLADTLTEQQCKIFDSVLERSVKVRNSDIAREPA